MQTTLKEQLIRTFPALLDSDYAENKILVADGWFNLLKNGLTELATYPISVTRIAERQGRLVIDYQLNKSINPSVASHIETIIGLIAKKSSTVCTECGEIAKTISTSSGVFTLCSKHESLAS